MAGPLRGEFVATLCHASAWAACVAASVGAKLSSVRVTAPPTWTKTTAMPSRIARAVGTRASQAPRSGIKRIDREKITLVVVVQGPSVDSSHGHGDVDGSQDHERHAQPLPRSGSISIPPQGSEQGGAVQNGEGRRQGDPCPRGTQTDRHTDQDGPRDPAEHVEVREHGPERQRLAQPVGSRCRGAVRTASAGGSRGRTPESSGARPPRADAPRRGRRENGPRGRTRARGSSSRTRVRAPGLRARRERRRAAMAPMRPGARGEGRACRGRARGGSGCGPGASNREESREVSPAGSPSSPPRAGPPGPTPDARPAPSRRWTAAPAAASGWRTRCQGPGTPVPRGRRRGLP